MSDELFRLRYAAGAYDDRFQSIRYPLRGGVPYERAEQMRLAMPEPDKFEIVSEDE